jgi:type I restriction enzyme S subunit
VNISDPKSYITKNSFVLERTINENISFEYLKYYCLNYDFTQFVTGYVKPQITIEELNNAEILIPPSILINKFPKIISNFETKIFSNKAQLKTLEKLRDTLLPKLMSGEVKII